MEVLSSFDFSRAYEILSHYMDSFRFLFNEDEFRDKSNFGIIQNIVG